MSMTIVAPSPRFDKVIEANCPTHGTVGLGYSIEQAEDQAIEHDMEMHPHQFAG